MSSLTPARLDPHNPRPNVKVESGFLSLYTSDEISDNKFGLESCREQLLSEVSRLLNKRSNNPSMAIPVTVFSFGGPRVGNAGFKERCDELGVKVLRIVNVNDPITKLPGVFLNENFRVLGGRYEFPWSCSFYAHVGVELALDFFNMQNPSCVHDLEAYISSLLAKCPKRSSSEEDDDHHHEVYFLNKAMDLLLSAENFNLLPLKIAVSNIMNSVQSQSTEFLINEHILGWMNTLALLISFLSTCIYGRRLLELLYISGDFVSL
ncbi:hypothetical protein GH714_009260 [Hevea brasiliensis]|uniref:Fungal lipase-type domain-containing protein n=1 Tax=Hevea brasiliensis TaxID=3981 RepID=A0A6A6NBJ5_HEVBR|nr:hypothetical protein GH714_009260 [Hevea brasiliensis]